MPIAFNCPNCGKQYRVKDELRGKTVTCKSCKQKLTVEANTAGDSEFFDFVDDVVAEDPSKPASRSTTATPKSRLSHRPSADYSAAKNKKTDSDRPLDVSLGELTLAGWLFLLTIGVVVFLVILVLMWGDRFAGPGIAMTAIVLAGLAFVGGNRQLNASGIAVFKSDRDPDKRPTGDATSPTREENPNDVARWR